MAKKKKEKLPHKMRVVIQLSQGGKFIQSCEKDIRQFQATTTEAITALNDFWSQFEKDTKWRNRKSASSSRRGTSTP